MPFVSLKRTIRGASTPDVLSSAKYRANQPTTGVVSFLTLGIRAPPDWRRPARKKTVAAKQTKPRVRVKPHPPPRCQRDASVSSMSQVDRAPSHVLQIILSLLVSAARQVVKPKVVHPHAPPILSTIWVGGGWIGGCLTNASTFAAINGKIASHTINVSPSGSSQGLQ